MCSNFYLELTEEQKAEYLAKVIILAQSEDYHLEVIELINRADRNNAFKKVSSPDLTNPQVKKDLADVDRRPIENYISDSNY